MASLFEQELEVLIRDFTLSGVVADLVGIFDIEDWVGVQSLPLLLSQQLDSKMGLPQLLDSKDSHRRENVLSLNRLEPSTPLIRLPLLHYLLEVPTCWSERLTEL